MTYPLVLYLAKIKRKPARVCNSFQREELLAVEEDRLAVRAGTTLDELDSYLESIILSSVCFKGVPLNFVWAYVLHVGYPILDCYI